MSRFVTGAFVLVLLFLTPALAGDFGVAEKKWIRQCMVGLASQRVAVRASAEAALSEMTCSRSAGTGHLTTHPPV